MTRLTVIVVAYNSSAVLPSLLGSIPAGTDVLVVDNASHDESIAVAKVHGARVLGLDRNVGFGAACNAGAAAVSTEFYLFCNPDIVFGPGALDSILDAARHHSRAVFNPRMISGWRQHFRRRSRLLIPLDWDEEVHDREEVNRLIPVLSGSCICIKDSDFLEVGGFDPAIFLYHEDDDLSLRLRQNGIELRLAGGAKIYHVSGHSSPRSVETARIKGASLADSLIYVMRKHGLQLDLMREYRSARRKLLLPHVFLVASRREKQLAFMRRLRLHIENLREQGQ